MGRPLRPGTIFPAQRPCERHEDVHDLAGQRIGGGGPCTDTDGRPAVHGKYDYPPRRNPTLRLSVAGAFLIAALLSASFFMAPRARPNHAGVDLRTAFSPGPTSSPHTLATFDCVQCHREGRHVEDVRCERCHDPDLSARLSQTAHVFTGTGDLQRAFAASPVACATCHAEHRGAEIRLADVNDRECGTCHRGDPDASTSLSSLARHPEFALVLAGTEAGTGLRWFNHQLHLTKVREDSGRECDACHERAPQAAAYLPITFARHCAGCHEPTDKDPPRSSGTLPARALDSVDPVPPRLKLQVDTDDPSRQQVTGIVHADPWVLRAVQSLRATGVPATFAAERIALDTQVAQLELLLRPAELAPAAWLNAADLESGADTRADAKPPQPDESVRAIAEAARRLAESLKAVDADRAAALIEAAAMMTRPIDTTARTSGADTERPPSDPLERLLDATVARALAAGNQALADRATALRNRLTTLDRARTASVTDAGDGLSALIRELGRVPDPGTRLQVAQLTVIGQLARQRANAGIDATAFDVERRQILVLLDRVQDRLRRSAGPSPSDPAALTLSARVAALRQRVLQTQPGLSPQLVATRAAFFQARRVDRTRVDGELTALQVRLPAAPRSPEPDRLRLQQRLDQLRRRLQMIGTIPAPSGSALPVTLRAQVTSALLGEEQATVDQNAANTSRCTHCHGLTADGSQLSPVRAAGTRFANATFTHAPHVPREGQGCDRCHASIRTSTLPSDVNVPGIDNCRSCHAPGREAARSVNCESCHRYHAPTDTALVWIP